MVLLHGNSLETLFFFKGEPFFPVFLIGEIFFERAVTGLAVYFSGEKFSTSPYPQRHDCNPDFQVYCDQQTHSRW